MIDLKELEGCLKLMVKYQVSEITTPEITIKKGIHLGPKLEKKKIAELPANYASDEDILFASSKAPRLTLDQFANYSANTPLPLKE